jgi:hypothetical protein
MKLKIQTVYDSKVGTFEKPFLMRSTAEGLRAWGSIVNDPDSQFSKHPEDFTLFESGEFDTETGILLPYQAPVSLSIALDAKNAQNVLNLAERKA